MFKNLRKKIEQGVAQSPLRGAIKTTSDDKAEGDDMPKNPADGSESDQQPDGTTSLIGHGSPAEMEPSSQTAVDSSPHGPQVGQLVDIPLFNHPLEDPMSPSNGTPQRTHSRQSSISSVTSESPFFPPLNLSHHSYDLPSEAESEMEESISNLDGYTKEDLYNVIKRLERRSIKYKGRFKDVVAAYKELRQDKEKIKNTLTQSQDKAFRRISELKEQANLDKLAKRDLEDNYRLMLEEKDELVRVLQTQVRLLKEGKEIPDEISTKGNHGDGDSGGGDGSLAALTDKVKRQEALLNRCKESIKSHKEKIAQLSSEKALLQKQLEEKGVEKVQDGAPSSPSLDEDNAKLRRQIKQARAVIEDLEADKQLAVAEAKQQMHEAIEAKDQEVVSLRSNLQSVTEEKQQLEEKVEKLEKSGQEHLQKSRDIIKSLKDEKAQVVTEMEAKLKVAEERLEQEKESLVQELARGKTAAVTLLQQESEKRLQEVTSLKEAAVQEQQNHWQEKLKQLESDHQERITLLETQYQEKITQLEAKHQEKIVQLEEQHQESLAMKDKEREHALEVKEGEIQKRLEEKENDMLLAVEERDLQKMAALSQQDSAKDELLQKIDSLNTAKLELENMLVKLREDHEAEVTAWAAEKEAHAAEINKMILEFQKATENLKSEFETRLEKQALSLNEVHAQEIEELNHRYQLKLEGSSTEVEEYYKSQLEAMKTNYEQLIHDKAMQIETVNQTMKELQETLQTSQAEFEEQLQEAIKSRETLVEKYESELQELKNDIQCLNQTKSELEKTVESKDIEMNALQATFKGNLEITNSEWKQKLDELESEHEKRIKEMSQSDESRVTEAESKVTELQQQLEEVRKTLQELTEAKQTLQDEKQVLQAAMDSLKKQVEEESHKSADVQENLEKKTEEINSLQKMMEEKETALSLMDARCQDLEVEVAQKSKAFDDKTAEIQQMQDKFGQLRTEAKSRIKDLKERTDDMAKDLSQKTEEVLSLTAKLEEASVGKSGEISELQVKLHESEEAQKALEESFKEKFDEKQKQYKEHLRKMKEAFQAKLNEKEKSFQEKLEELTRDRDLSVEGVTANLESLRQQQLDEISASHKRQLEETVSDWENRLVEVKEASESEKAALKQDYDQNLTKLQAAYEKQLAEVTEAHQSAVEKLQSDLDSVNEKLKEAEAAIEMVNAQKVQELSSVTEELKALQTSCKEKESLLSEHQTMEQQIQELKHNIESVTEKHTLEIQEKDLALQSAEEKIRHLESTSASLEKTIQTVSDSSKEQEDQIKCMEENHQTVINTLEASLQDKCVLLEELQQKLQHAEHTCAEKDTVVIKLTEELSGVKTQLEALERDLSKKEHVIADMQGSAEAASAENQRLREHHEESLQRMETEMGTRVKEQQSEMEERLRQAMAEEERLKGKSSRDEDRLMLEHKQVMEELYNDLHEKDKHIEEMTEKHTAQLEEKEKEGQERVAALQQELTVLQEKITLLSDNHKRELQTLEQRLEEGFKKRLAEKEVVHQEEIDALSKEWNTERQAKILTSQNISTPQRPQEMVMQNQFALEAIQSGSATGDLLRQEIINMTVKMEEQRSKHKLELAELRSQMEMSQNRTPLVAPPGQRNLYDEFEPRAAEEIQNLELHNLDLQAQVSQLTEELHKMEESERQLHEKMNESAVHHSSSFHTPGASFHTPPSSPHPLSVNSTPSGPLLTEPTEMEYLRNILFQYMIGKETKTLAKVIATVMKFTDDQTAKILSCQDSKAGGWLTLEYTGNR